MKYQIGYSNNDKTKVGYSINELNRANNDIDADRCTDCGMSADHKDFNWHHPEAMTDEEMGVVNEY